MYQVVETIDIFLLLVVFQAEAYSIRRRKARSNSVSAGRIIQKLLESCQATFFLFVLSSFLPARWTSYRVPILYGSFREESDRPKTLKLGLTLLLEVNAS